MSHDMHMQGGDEGGGYQLCHKHTDALAQASHYLLPPPLPTPKHTPIHPRTCLARSPYGMGCRTSTTRLPTSRAASITSLQT